MKLRTTSVLAASSLLVLGACADTGMMGTTGGDNTRTKQGALAGAAVGAIYGATRDDDSNNQGRDAARGAIIGAAAGALAGNILDRQAAALRSSISNPNVQSVNHGSYLQVVLPEGILFATDSAAAWRSRILPASAPAAAPTIAPRAASRPWLLLSLSRVAP